MITDPKSLVDMGFNVAIMASFATPAGAPLAATLAGTQAIFDIFFKIPKPNRSNPGAMMATKNDIQNAINQIKAFISENTFQAELDTKSNKMMAVNDQLRQVWVKNSTLTPITKRGPLSQGQFSAAQVASWKDEIDGYHQPILNVPSPFIETYTWIEGDSAHKYQTLGLYSLAASLWNALCKLNIAFEFNMAIQDYQAAMAQHTIDENLYHTAHSAWKYGDQDTRGPEPLEPVEPIKPEDNDAFLNGSIWADKITLEIDRFINYATPLVKQLESDFNIRKDTVNDRLAQVTLKSAGKKWYYHDALLNTDSVPETYKAVAQGQMEVYTGALKLAMWDRLTTQYGLIGIEEDQIETLKNTLVEWAKTKTNISAI